MNIYERNINTSIETVGGDFIITRASLLDLDHNIRIRMMIRISTREIVNASVEMVKTPFETCKLALPNINSLEGLKIERGFAKKMRLAVGGSGGCAHIAELVLTAATLSSNAMLLEPARDPEERKRFSRKTDKEKVEELKPFLKDSCIVFKE